MSITKVTDTYLDLKRIKLDNMSMCKMFNILKDENNEYFMNIFKNVEIDVNSIDPTNTTGINIVEPWWEMISYSFYGDVEAWWITCLTNSVINPFEEIVEGGSLNMLSKGFIPYIQRDLEVVSNL